MDKEKAKYILGAYQAGLPPVEEDEEMAAALEEVRHDPELAAWLQRETEFDARISAAFQDIPVPSSLRRSILEGMELSARRRAWWRRPLIYWGGGLSLAGATALALWMTLRVDPAAPVRPGGPDIVSTSTSGGAYEPWQLNALNTLNSGFQFELDQPDRKVITGWLMGRGLPVPDSILAKVEDQQIIGCFTVRNLPAAKTSTICMRSKDGPVVHVVSEELPTLAVNQGQDLGAPPGVPRLGSFGGFNTLSWREPGKGIMLVTEGPADVLKRFAGAE